MDLRQLADGDLAARLGAHGVEARRCGGRDGGQLHRHERGGGAPDPGEGQQVVDQSLHALGAVDGELDVLVGALVELPAVAALQELAEAGDLAQRLLQVVAGDVGELLEIAVGPLQLLGLLVEAAVDLLRGVELAQDVHAHRLDVLGELADLARSRRPDLVLHVAGHHVTDLLGEPGQRAQHAEPQPETGRDEEPGQHRRDAEPDDDHERRRLVDALAGGRLHGPQVVQHGGQVGPHAVEQFAALNRVDDPAPRRRDRRTRSATPGPPPRRGRRRRRASRDRRAWRPGPAARRRPAPRPPARPGTGRGTPGAR